MTDALRKLIEDVEAGLPSPTNWRDFAAVPATGDADNPGFILAHSAYHGSLDAAKALHEALLPGWIFDVTTDSAFVCPQEYVSFDDIPDHIRQFSGENDTTARAWLLALLRAKLAEGGSDG